MQKKSNMKKLLVIIFSLLISIPSIAQLEVKDGSFREVNGFVNINSDENYQYDDNNLPFAVVKVRTENITDKQRRELRFEGNGGTFIMLEYKTGEVWVYLTARYADYLKISHPDFGVFEYTFPHDLQPKKGYEMALVYKPYSSGISVKEVYNYLIVKADQPNAIIYIDNEYVGEHEVYKSFKAGEKHTWRIECELYHSDSGEATIPFSEGENLIVDKVLLPAFGYLNVTSSPENGAVVFVDGKKVGQTPYKSDKMASGGHTVRVMKEMYSTAEKTFAVTDGDTTQALMTMTANFVDVIITTDSESDIYIDNEKKGTGTWRGRLNDGSHCLEARKASHKTSIKIVQLVLGKDETIVIPNPEPIFGTLDIASNPMGANVIIDGNSLGTTPMVWTTILVGNHELKIEKKGYVSVIETITLDEVNKLTINETLRPGGEISITTDKNGDKIYVDGDYVGVSPLTTTLSFGEHNVKAMRDGKETSKKITVAQTGGVTSLQLTFAKTFTVNNVTFEMVYVEGGTFTMGCTSMQEDCLVGEKPTHSVTLSDYYIGKYEVTQALWQAVMGNNPSKWKGDDLPVEKVSWNDVQAFIKKLNRLTGAKFRLPTEAEWEYAARGGEKSKGYRYSGGNILESVAWFSSNSGYKTHAVGMKSPNELGIYDMNGNVEEWCQDWKGDYSEDGQINPTGPSSCSYNYRVWRGGGCDSWENSSRVWSRGGLDPAYGMNTIGFRLALEP